jgi:hypothetical protein
MIVIRGYMAPVTPDRGKPDMMGSNLLGPSQVISSSHSNLCSLCGELCCISKFNGAGYWRPGRRGGLLALFGWLSP